jgi:hypothetical protein
MPKKHYLTIAAAAILGLSGFSTAFAGTETSGTEGKTVVAPTPPAAANSYITGDFGVTFTSEYLSRGIVQEKQTEGVIAEPYLDIYIKLYSGNGFINSVSAQLSFWSNIGSNVKTANPSSTTPNWEEFDWDPGFSVTFAQNFTLLIQYFEFDSPAGAFGTARSIDANLTYNDAGWWTNPTLSAASFSIHPHVTVLYELGAPGFAGLQGKGWYYELGIAPSWTFLPKATYPITVSLPVTLGLGDDHGFYAGNTYGYLAVGPSVSVPLAFIPAGFGSWTLTAAYTYYDEGTTVRAANAFPAGNGSESRHVFSGAIGVTF